MEKSAEYSRRWREKNLEQVRAANAASARERRAAGLVKPLTEEQKKKRSDANKLKRMEAAALRPPTVRSPRTAKPIDIDAVNEARRKKYAEQSATGQTWPKLNADRHRNNTQKWRSKNTLRSQELGRSSQAKRRATSWGQINNRMWPIIHGAVRRNSTKPSKYTTATGYLWCDLRAHLESLFDDSMTWGNWGDIWELDHIVALSSFKYQSLEDPLFRDCWRLSNLRPLCRIENGKKGAKIHPLGASNE